jgi:enterochelin esterase-like enzyme
MKTRRAMILVVVLPLFSGLWACVDSQALAPTPTILAPTVTSTPIPDPTPSPTATPITCLTQPGQLKQDSLTTTNPVQEFLIYLPPCYQEFVKLDYPVVYLLHGRTYTDDQWVRIGAVAAADRLLISQEVLPFIMVFPDDRYWNLPAGPGFGDRLLELIPYIDKNYRTIADRNHRALGGLSRGGGWTVRLGLNHWELFGALGLHSPAVFKEDGGYFEKWIEAIPPESRPRLWLDIGDQDTELGNAHVLEEILTDDSFPHEFHLYSGDHSETYWRLHVEEYLRWYAKGWSDQNGEP